MCFIIIFAPPLFLYSLVFASDCLTSTVRRCCFSMPPFLELIRAGRLTEPTIQAIPTVQRTWSGPTFSSVRGNGLYGRLCHRRLVGFPTDLVGSWLPTPLARQRGKELRCRVHTAKFYKNVTSRLQAKSCAGEELSSFMRPGLGPEGQS